MSTRTDVAQIFLQGIETSLTNQVPPACFAMLPAEAQATWTEKIDAAVEVVCGRPDGALYDPHQVGGGPGGGGGQEEPPPGVLYGAVSYVDLGDNAPVLPARAVVLGDKTAPEETLPNGAGIVQRYRGGVVLINTSADPFLLSLENVQAMAPAGFQLGLPTPGTLEPVVPITSAVAVAPGTRIVLVVLQPPPAAP